MIGSDLVVEGLQSNLHQRDALSDVGSLRFSHNFGSLNHLMPTTNRVPSQNHIMSGTFAEPFLKTTGGPLLPGTEFLRPLPKPAPIVATRYNGGINSMNGMNGMNNSMNGCIRSISKYSEMDSGPVNLTQKDVDSRNGYGLYTTTRMYTPPTYSHFPPPALQTGPYGSLYPPNPYAPLIRDNGNPQHSLPLQQYANSNAMLMKSSTANTVITSKPQEEPLFKVPSGKEGSMKHRILTRPEKCRKVTLQRAAPPISSPAKSQSPEKNGLTLSPPISPKTATANNTPQPQSNFTKGSLIRLASGEVKRVEDMRIEDFVSSTEKCPNLRCEPSTVVRIQENALKKGIVTLTLMYGDPRHQTDYETSLERPYFVFGRGWSSCSPSKSMQTYGLHCHRLQVGDICISLAPKVAANGLSNGLKKVAKLPHCNDLTNVKDMCSESGKSADRSCGFMDSNSRKRMLAKEEHSDGGNDKVDEPKRKRRWSAPEQITDEYQSSPMSSPISITSVLSSPSSVGSNATAKSASKKE